MVGQKTRARCVKIGGGSSGHIEKVGHVEMVKDSGLKKEDCDSFGRMTKWSVHSPRDI